MKTICIAGTSSGVGKTAVAEMLLRRLKGWSAAKISVGHVVSGNRPFDVLSRGPILDEEGSDTARLRAAGARRVILVSARRRSVKAAVGKMLLRLGRDERIIVEGNSFARLVTPDLTIMVAPVRQRTMKPSAKAILPRVDIVLLRADPKDSPDAVRRGLTWWKNRLSTASVCSIRSFKRPSPAFLRHVLKGIRQPRHISEYLNT